MATRHRLSLIIFSGDFDRVHYAFAMASAAAATDRPVTMFFSGRALRFFLAEAADGTPGWAALAPAENGKTAIERDTELCNDGIGTIEELAMACVELNVAFSFWLGCPGYPNGPTRVPYDAVLGCFESFLS